MNTALKESAQQDGHDFSTVCHGTRTHASCDEIPACTKCGLTTESDFTSRCPGNLELGRFLGLLSSIIAKAGLNYNETGWHMRDGQNLVIVAGNAWINEPPSLNRLATYAEARIAQQQREGTSSEREMRQSRLAVSIRPTKQTTCAILGHHDFEDGECNDCGEPDLATKPVTTS